jgi:C1A family cysteine protease
MSLVRDGNGVARHLGGWRRDLAVGRQAERRLKISPVTLPDRIDLREQCPEVVDQGSIGSCVANACCSAMAFLEREALASLFFSRLFLYYFTRVAEGIPPTEDSGTLIRVAIQVLIERGVPYESTWPYDPAEERFSLVPSSEAQAEALEHRALFFYSCVNTDGAPSLFAIKASLSQGFPVVVGFAVPENMMSAECAETGIVEFPASGEGLVGGHAVLRVGYDDNMMVGSDKGAWLCLNSWGSSWGINGYFWLPYRFDTAGLAADPWTIRKAMV